MSFAPRRRPNATIDQLPSLIQKLVRDHLGGLGTPTLVRTRPDKSARRPVVGQASPHEVHVVYFRHAPDDHRQTEMSSQAAPRRRELATSDPLGIGVPTDSAVAPPEGGFCYHAATTLSRTRTPGAKVWSVRILGLPRGWFFLVPRSFAPIGLRNQ